MPRGVARGLVGLAFVAAAGGPARGQLAAYDPFNQPGTPSQLNGTASSGGGAVWPAANQTWGPKSGNGGTVTAGSLGYGPLATSGSSATVSGFSGELNGSQRLFGSTLGGAGADLWISVLMRGTAPEQGLVLYNSLTPDAYFGTFGGGGGYGMRLAEPATGTPSSATVAAGPAVPAGSATHLLVAHLALGSAGQKTSTVTLYVDPDAASLGTGAAPTGGSVATYTTALAFGFDRAVLYNGSGQAGGAVGAAAFDELRVGSSWAAVSPVVAPVPEPGTVLGVAAAGLGLAGWASRRRPARA